MKKFIKIIFFLLVLLNISFTFAGTIDHFEVEFGKDKVIVGDAVDLTIKAVDENGDIVKDYTGNILAISQTDDDVQLPSDLASDDGYSFKLSDQGIKKFENGIIFSVDGEQKLTIYDVNDYQNLIGEGKIIVIEKAKTDKNVEIEILNPEKNTTLSKKEVKISGATKKNHQVKIVINNELEILTTSNSDGIFEKDTILEDGQNVLKAYTLDADDNIIGESSEVIIKIESNKPIFRKIELSPISETGSVEEGTNIDVKVFATKKLKSTKILFNDQVIQLSETEEGIYTGSFKAPNKEEVFPIDVILVDDMGHSTTKKNITSINVYLIDKNSAEPVEEKTDIIKKECDLKIEQIKVVKLKNKSIVTWNKLQDATSYDVYMKNDNTKEFEFIKNVIKPIFEIDIMGKKIKYNDFAIKAKNENDNCNGKNGTGSVVYGDLSEATKVQTGPTQILIILILSLLLGLGIFFTQRKQY